MVFRHLHLTSKVHKATASRTSNATVRVLFLSLMNTAKQHVVYLYLLQECLNLYDRDAKEIERLFGITQADSFRQGVRSVPSKAARLVFMHELSKTFDYDLTGVPGFFYNYEKELPVAWQINLPEHGMLKPYTDESNGIAGIYTYRFANDSRPKLLSSKNLTLGTEATQPLSSLDRSIV